MLTQLAIQDYAIVDRLELDLTRGMTAITGETGAGKSILLGALGLCLGERADAGSVRHGCERTDLSARFDIQHLPAAAEWLDARELPAELPLQLLLHFLPRQRGFVGVRRTVELAALAGVLLIAVFRVGARRHVLGALLEVAVDAGAR